jgi:hypothetical protein
MRRSNLRKHEKEGYRWFRFQESKLITVFFLTLFAFTLSPFYSELRIDFIPHFVLAILTGIFSKYIFTEFHIASEESGIYFEINKKQYIKLIKWNQTDYRFKTIKTKYNKLPFHNKEIILTSNGKEVSIHQPLCNNMHDFFNTSCKELQNAYQRNLTKNGQVKKL